MLSLNIPEQKISIKATKEGPSVLDPIRRKYLQITPEEWVRQNLLQHLICDKGFLKTYFRTELEFHIHQKKYRSDLVYFSKANTPLLLIECKAPYIEINDQTLQQILQYNIHFNAPYLLLSNGIKHHFLEIKTGQVHAHLEKIPTLSSLKQY